MRALWLSLLATGCLGDSEDDTAGAAGYSSSAPDAVAQEFLDAHNAVRSELGIPPMDWDRTVADSARTWAERLASESCAFYHDNQQTYGENLWWSSWDPTPTEVVDGWASEVAYYDYDNNRCAPGEMCGHYTQVVWADTTHVGCGKATCDSGAVIWNCRYSPPGNWVGEKPY